MPPLHKRSNMSLVIPFVVLALVFAVLIWGKYKTSRMVKPTPPVQQPAGQHTAVLFFIDEGGRLVKEGRQMEACSGTEVCMKAVLDELFNGPVGELDEALPEGTALKGVQVVGDMAVVDLSRDFSEEAVSGSSAEMAAVYSIVNTVCVNFPSVSKVKLNIEGDEKAVLKHLDLSDPLAPDFSLEQSPAPLPADPAASSPKNDARKGTK